MKLKGIVARHIPDDTFESKHLLSSVRVISGTPIFHFHIILPEVKLTYVILKRHKDDKMAPTCSKNTRLAGHSLWFCFNKREYKS